MEKNGSNQEKNGSNQKKNRSYQGNNDSFLGKNVPNQEKKEGFEENGEACYWQFPLNYNNYL